MTEKLQFAARQALEALEVSTDWDVGAKGKQLQSMKAITALRDALAEQAEQEPFDMDDHPPHRLCECRKCMEYFTPLPDCDAFAASGKPIDHIANADKMIGCAYCDNPLFAGTKCNNCGRVTLAEPVKQEPVAVISESAIGLVKLHSNGACLPFGTQLYAAPVSAPKQEPVAWAYFDADGTFMDALDRQHGAYQTPLHAAPVSAKAIRAEALEEAAKVCRTAQAKGLQSIREAIEAAIRGLK